MKPLLEDAARRAAAYLGSLPERAVAPRPEALRALSALDVPLQEESRDPQRVLAELDELVTPATMAMAGPRFFGFVIGGSLPAALAANWLAGAWDETKMDVLLLLAPTVRAIGYRGRGDFRMDTTGRLTRRPEREVVPFAYAGAAILHPRIFDGAPDGPFSLNLLFDKAAEAERLFGVRMDGLWLHVGTPEAIGEAEMSIADSAA